jgi:hypothetical protein
MGCYSNYTVQDFPSKEKFYEDFNNSVKNREIKVAFTNDSLIYYPYGVILEHDTIFSNMLKPYPLSGILKIDYSNSDYKSANILLKNGSNLQVQDIKMGIDSIYFYDNNSSIKGNYLFPVDKVKSISYKRTWPGIASGFLIGAPLGFLTALLIGNSIDHSQYGSGIALEYRIFGAPIGAIIGGIIGGILEYNYTYKFSQ